MLGTNLVYVPGRITNSLFGPNKGVVNNRMECAGEQIKNTASKGIQSCAVIGTTAGITYAASKSPVISKVVMGGLKSIRNLMGKNRYTNKVASAITKALSGFSTTTKIGAALTLAALPLLYIIDHKETYRAGQIDQEYTDRAAVQSKMNDMVSINNLY